ncbi:hypothetical protein ACVIYL_000020 [Bradyrhizobium sp. USDA 3315]
MTGAYSNLCIVEDACVTIELDIRRHFDER